MGEKHLVCKGATVYCSKSVSNNNPVTAIPLNITSQTTVVINGGKVVATDKDSKVVNMNFGLCNMGSTPVPCNANILWSKLYDGADITKQRLKLLTEDSQGSCMCGGGKIKVAFNGQVATPQMGEKDVVSYDVISAIMPVIPEIEEEEIHIENLGLTDTTAEKRKILSIDILDDNGDAIKENYVHFVNLSKESKFIDNKDIKGLYQLGTTIRCLVKFNGGGSNHFKLTIVGEPNNVVYSDAEKSRNPNFRSNDTPLSFVTDINGEKIIKGEALFFNQAGGNCYYLRAEDTNNNIVESVKITTHRKLYFVEVKMKGLDDMVKDLAVVKQEYENNFITLEKYAEIYISHFKNIGKGDSTEKEFKKSVKTAYSKHNKMSPFCIAIAYTDHLAIKESNVIIETCRTFDTEQNEKQLRVEICNHNGETVALWCNIDKDDWFGSCKFIDLKGKKTTVKKNKITPIISDNGRHEALYVDIKALPKKDGKIVLKLNIINRMRGGLSFGGNNVVAICTKAWFTPVEEYKQIQSIIHEVGHKVGMVPEGDGKALDKPINFYNDKDKKGGHVGRHCHRGIPKQDRYDEYSSRFAPTCVMYGARCNSRKNSFCIDCAKCVRKLELCIGDY